MMCGAVDGDEIVFSVALPDGVTRGNTTYSTFCMDVNANVTSLNDTCVAPWNDDVCSYNGSGIMFVSRCAVVCKHVCVCQFVDVCLV